MPLIERKPSHSESDQTVIAPLRQATLASRAGEDPSIYLKLAQINVSEYILREVGRRPLDSSVVPEFIKTFTVLNRPESAIEMSKNWSDPYAARNLNEAAEMLVRDREFAAAKLIASEALGRSAKNDLLPFAIEANITIAKAQSELGGDFEAPLERAQQMALESDLDVQQKVEALTKIARVRKSKSQDPKPYLDIAVELVGSAPNNSEPHDMENIYKAQACTELGLAWVEFGFLSEAEVIVGVLERIPDEMGMMEEGVREVEEALAKARK